MVCSRSGINHDDIELPESWFNFNQSSIDLNRVLSDAFLAFFRKLYHSMPEYFIVVSIFERSTGASDDEYFKYESSILVRAAA